MLNESVSIRPIISYIVQVAIESSNSAPNIRALLIDIIPKRIEVLEVVNDEVYGGSWAPDAHILVIASKESLYFVSREFEIISQEQLNPTSPGQCKLLSSFIYYFE
uniref:Uncharacterized protein n=1 Tax=Parascaris equorum TaxID=6256 RepID=A0A914RGD3_PAREQ